LTDRRKTAFKFALRNGIQIRKNAEKSMAVDCDDLSSRPKSPIRKAEAVLDGTAMYFNLGRMNVFSTSYDTHRRVKSNIQTTVH
jgi:hypothetical protein